MKYIIVLFYLSFIGPSVLAHGDVHARIQKLTRQLKETPDDPSLYMERGILYHTHEVYDSASWDLEKAIAIIPNFYNAHIYLAEAYLGLDLLDKAIHLLNKHAETYEENYKWYIVRGHVLYKQGLYEEATENYLTVLNIREEPVPQDFFNYAKAEIETGPEGITRAIHVIDQVEADIGWLITLKRYNVDLELKRGNYDGALVRMDEIIDNMPRKEKWLTEKGDILVLAGRKKEATKNYNDALSAIANLSPRTRNLASTIALEKRIIQAIKNSY